MHSSGWYVGSEHRGLVFGMIFCVCEVDDVCNGIWMCG